jgi:lipopolysaccharide transport system ATP-binding protein
MSFENEVAIEVEGLTKHYETYRNPRDRLKQMIFPRLYKFLGLKEKNYAKPFVALENVTFKVMRGETFGIIGRNGSGKSTLLQILCGTLPATSGKIQVHGKVAALLELGAGFNPEFSGKDNVYMCGRLYGLSTKEIDERFEKITEFADIGDFIGQPVKTYSSGMYVRLAFAVIAHVDADVLVIDEALSVGDAYFVQKCMRFLRQFMERGTLLFVSHDISAVTNLCSNALWLDKGHLKMMGEPKELIKKYLEGLVSNSQDVDKARTLAPKSVQSGVVDYVDMRDKFINASNLRNDIQILPGAGQAESYGAGGAKILECYLEDGQGSRLTYLVGGESVCLHVIAEATQDLERIILGFDLKNRLGQTIFGDNTFLTYQMDSKNLAKGQRARARFEFRMPVLAVGDYAITVAIATGTQESHVQQHWVHDILILKAHSSRICFGVFAVPMKNIEIHCD